MDNVSVSQDSEGENVTNAKQTTMGTLMWSAIV